jgi:predicted negative regulator of RcsB-dependent stress response
MLTRLLAANDQDTEARLDLGDVLFMMGDRDGARQQWNQAMTVDASAADIVQKARRRLDLYGPTAPGEQAAAAAGRR